MKRITLLTINMMCFLGVFTTINQNAFAQGNNGGNANTNNNANGTALKWEIHGNEAGPDDFIGTTNPTALKMRTNNVERFKITPDGKIGVGIANPLEKFELQGNLKLSGDVIFSKYGNDTIDKILFLDETGKTITKDLKRLTQELYRMPYSDCLEEQDNDAVEKAVNEAYPTWHNGPNKIFHPCPVSVGIGTHLPDARLDVKGDARFSNGVRIGNQDGTETALHLENYSKGGNYKKFNNLIIVKDHENNKILQLNNNGLLRAREIKVDEEAWPDYVFKPNYDLMQLNKVKEFIAQNGHLPNVPSAEEIEADGVNLGETAKITMEKVEELTLYVIDQQEQIDEQQKQIDEQQKLLEKQRKLLEAQQAIIEKQQFHLEGLNNN